MDHTFKFTEENIQRIFGHEAAEDEDPTRLREYYFKTQVFKQMTADLPLRILVGHKGIGKSALFKVALLEDGDSNNLPVLIRPDDVVGIGNYTGDFQQSIRDWKQGLSTIIGDRVLQTLGYEDKGILGKAKSYGGKLIALLSDVFAQVGTVSLTPAKRAVVEKFIQQKKIHVYIDDLDRGWESRPEDIRRISAMFNAIRDLLNENEGFRFRIALRADVYHLYRTSDESTDKIEAQVVWHSWTNHEIFVMLVKRITTYFDREVSEGSLLTTRQKDLSQYLDTIMVQRFEGMGHWENIPCYRVLMSLIRKRPRDLVKLCTLAARKALEGNHSIITSKDLESVFEDYSQGRIQDTINEYRSELPDIGRLLFGMKPSKKERTAREGYVYATDALLKKINQIMEQGEFKFTNGKRATAQLLAQFMYKINFLTARKATDNNLIIRKYFEEARYLSSDFVDFGFAWEIHPAYRWALQPDSIRDIYASLALSADDK